MQLGRFTIGRGAPCFMIAEIGVNHGGDPEAARTLIRAAAQAGANAVKFQTYVTENRVPRDNPVYAILKRCELSHDIQADLKHYAENEAGVLFFSTPFDDEAVSFLDGIGVPAFKVASFDIVNHALLRRIAATGKPVIISSGMAARAEIDAAIALLSPAPLALLHCVSAYPTPIAAADLETIRTLAAIHPGIPVGYSDHTLGVEAAVLAVAAGAHLIEKHFTLDPTAPGPDHALSADPASFRAMVEAIRRLETILGPGELRTRPAEAGTTIFRRPTA